MKVFNFISVCFKEIPYAVYCLSLLCSSVQAQDISELVKTSAENYTYMWWINSVKEQSPLKFAVKTANYSFVFDYENLQFDNIDIVNGGSSDKVFMTKRDEILGGKEKPLLEFGIETYGKLYPCLVSSLRSEDCQLIHSGRFLQHRFINWIPGLTGCDPHYSGLDIVAWNDRLTLNLQVVPMVNLRAKSISVNFTVPVGYSEIPTTGDKKIFCNKAGKGYVILPVDKAVAISVHENCVTARLSSDKNFQAGEKLSVGLVIYPVTDAGTAVQIETVEKTPVVVTAVQKKPCDVELDVAYNPVMGWHQISLRNDVTKNPEKDNDHIEQVLFTAKNDNPYPVPLRVNFSKEGEVFSITGISAMIRDREGNPTGIPVQLSKNWHTIDFNQYKDHLYRGKWYHGLTVLEIPAHSSLTLEYAGLNANWGNVPAASHAQLCLVGWGQNQLWDQSAIGSWGENICYEPDLDQASAPVLDVRPLLILNPAGDKWEWTGNVGGADFLNMKRMDGKRAWHTGMRVQYKRYCPNLTEVVYAGTMDDDKVDICYTTSIGRSDDITRGIFKIRMDVRDNIEFSDLAIFQLNAEKYHYSISKKLNIGNENGLIRTWNTVSGDTISGFVGKKEPFKGRIPWIAYTASSLEDNQLETYRAADRGFTLRNWKIKINGKEDIVPHWQEYYTAEGGHGEPASIVNLTLPESITSLAPGDYIEAEIEMFILPVNVKDYYGSNENLRTALKSGAGTWKPARREAVGNNIIVTTVEGKCFSQYPIVIETVENKAQFKVKGGIGYVPLTITGLTAYCVPRLSVFENGSWKNIDQSKYGKDFWQTDYNTATGRWEISYNVNLDTPGDKVVNRDFRFELIK
jgi:hypothetical protein